MLSENYIDLKYAICYNIADNKSEYVHKLKTGKVDDKIMDAFLQKFYDGGFNRGHSEGKLEGKIETAKNMLLKNLPLDIIASCTNLSLTEVQQLQKTMQ